jgi:hypothetical protein
MRPLATVDLRRVRLAGRVPRVALLTTCAVLTVGGGLRLFSRAPQPIVRSATSTAAPAVAEIGLAQRFAIAYLTLKPGIDDARTERLTALGFADGGVAPDRVGRVERQVVGTVVAGVARQGGHVVRVTVGVDDGQTWTYLAVPVRNEAGRLSVPNAPAIVGPPAVARNPVGPVEDEVQDTALKQVITRVLRHYLARDRSDLAADLVPGVQPSLPETAWRPLGIDAVTWAVPPRRAAVTLRAQDPGGLRLTLRYELTVVRRGGRWLVAAVFTNPNPNHQEQIK